MVTLREILGKSYWGDGNWLNQPRIFPNRDVLLQHASPSGSTIRQPRFRTASFCVITQRVMVIPYRHSGQPISPNVKGQESFLLCSWPSKMVLIGCPETSVSNYHYLLSNNPEERSSLLLRGGSLKSRTTDFVIVLVCCLVNRNIKCWADVITERITTAGFAYNRC
jgi:hypothetical protein